MKKIFIFTIIISGMLLVGCGFQVVNDKEQITKSKGQRANTEAQNSENDNMEKSNQLNSKEEFKINSSIEIGTGNEDTEIDNQRKIEDIINEDVVENKKEFTQDSQKEYSKNNQEQIENSSDDFDNVEAIFSNVDISNWETYYNEEYGFEMKYPNGWYFEDYTEEFGFSKMGFYPNNKKRGYEYIGDPIFSINAKEGDYKNIVRYYQKRAGVKEFVESEKLKKYVTKNKYNVVYDYDQPCFFGLCDDVSVDCFKNYAIIAGSVINQNRDVLKGMIDSLVCY